MTPVDKLNELGNEAQAAIDDAMAAQHEIDELAAPPGLAPHPGENHDFRIICARCGELGLLHVAIIGDDEVFRVENRAALDPGEIGPQPR